MNRDEQELVNVFNSVNNLAGTFARTRAQGIQTDELLKEKADKERQVAIDNRMTTGLSRGESPQQLSRETAIPGAGPGWKDDYNSLNVGLKPGNKDYVPAEGFTRSSDAVGSAEVQAGLKTALENKISTEKAIHDDAYNTALNSLRGQPIEKVLAMGDDLPADVFRARGQYLLEYAQQEAPRATIKKARNEAADDLYKKVMGELHMADLYEAKGDHETAGAIRSDAINKSNLDYQSEKQPDGTYLLYLDTPEGRKSDGTKYKAKELGAAIRDRISKGPHLRDQIRAHMDLAEQDNAASIKNPTIMIVPGTNHMVQTIRSTDPLTEKITYTNFDNNKKKIGNYSPDQLRSMGLFDYKKDFYVDPGAARLNDAKIRKEEAGIGLIKAQTEKAKLGGGGGRQNLQAIRDKRKEATKAFAQDLWSKGIEVNFDPDTGEINIDKNTMLTQAQKDMVDKVASQYGFNASLRPVEDGIDNGWFRDDTVGYRFGGVSGFEAPGAKGLSRPGTNQGKSGPVMSRGEFDATITGQENKQPPVKTGKGLIERAYNSVVPADGFADTVVKKGFGPIPGQAKELAGVVYEKGLKPIPGQVKGAAKAVAKPFAAPYSAAAKLTKLKVLKNQLSHAESDKEKKEIKAEIEALSKSK